MKKIYIIPTLNVVKIQPTCMLNESMGMKGDLDGNVTIGARRARFSDWEEEDCELLNE